MLAITDRKGVNEKVLAKALGDAAVQFLESDVEKPIEPNRVVQIAIAKRNQLYYQGKQYLYPVGDKASGTFNYESVLDRVPKGKRVLASCYNIVYADGVKYANLIAQRRLNQKVVPDDQGSYETKQQMRQMNALMQRQHRQWNIGLRMAREVAPHQWTTGPVFGYTRYRVDPVNDGYESYERMGMEEIARPEMFMCVGCGQPQPAGTGPCPNCGTPLESAEYQPPGVEQMPVPMAPEKKPRGHVELDLLTSLHITTARDAKEIKKAHWLKKTGLLNKWELMGRFNIAAEEAERGEWVDELAMLTVSELESEIGDRTAPDPHRFLVNDRWITPEVYEGFGPQQRKDLKRLFPNGCRLTSVGKRLAQMANEILHEYWAVCRPGDSGYINSQAMCTNIIPVQDDINNFFNMVREILLRAIPKTLVDSALLNKDDLKRHEAEAIIAEAISVHAHGQDMNKMMAKFPTASVSEQLLPFAQVLREYSRDIDGVQQALYGGGPSSPTLGEAIQKKNQALVQFTGPTKEIVQFGADISTNGLREEIRYGIGRVVVPPERRDAFSTTVEVDIEKLPVAGWRIEADEMIPVTLGEKQERVTQLMDANPALAAVIGPGHPANVEPLQELFGVDGLYSPGEFETNRAHRLIQELLQETPIEAIDPMTFMPTRMPSRQIDMFIESNHLLFAELFRTYCMSPAGEDQEQKNPEGFENVRLYGAEHEKLALPPPLPPGEEGAEGVGGQPAELPPAEGGGMPAAPEPAAAAA